MKLRKLCTLLSAVVLLLLINTVQLKAQGLPCGDPDIDCPIDAPVILLATIVLFLSVKKIAGANRTLKQTA